MSNDEDYRLRWEAFMRDFRELEKPGRPSAQKFMTLVIKHKIDASVAIAACGYSAAS